VAAPQPSINGHYAGRGVLKLCGSLCPKLSVDVLLCVCSAELPVGYSYSFIYVKKILWGKEGG
jgi:hypothetical protein